MYEAPAITDVEEISGLLSTGRSSRNNANRLRIKRKRRRNRFLHPRGQ